MDLSQLEQWFKGSSAFRNLSEESQRSYSRHLQRVVAMLGKEREAMVINADDADELYKQIETVSGTHAAVSCCRVSRLVWNLAKRRQYVTHNPFEKMRHKTLNRRDVIWVPEDVEAFYQTSIKKNLHSIGILIQLCYTFSQRPIDMLNLQWDDYDGETLGFRQKKTRRKAGSLVRLYVPDHMRLILDNSERLTNFIVTYEKTKQPYSHYNYNTIFHYVKHHAKIPNNLQIRDLRRTGLTEMGDSGATDQELMTHGHMDRETLSIYTMRSIKQSKNAMNKRFKK